MIFVVLFFLCIILIQYPLFQKVGVKKYALYLNIIFFLFIIYFGIILPILNSHSHNVKLPPYVIYFGFFFLPLFIIFSVILIVFSIHLYNRKEKKLLCINLGLFLVCCLILFFLMI